MTALNPLYDPATDNQPIPSDVQHRLNQALTDDSGFSQEEQQFLQDLMKKVEEGKIQLYTPSSLLNAAVYEALSPEAKAKADQNCVILLGKIRDIVNLMKINQEPTFEIKNMVESLHYTKSRLEEHSDLFII